MSVAPPRVLVALRTSRSPARLDPPRTVETPPEDLQVPPPVEETEAYSVLLSRATRKTDPIPAELLVRHILDVTRDGDWPLQREAMNALLRRLSFLKRDSLVLAARPPGTAVLGPYTTRRQGSEKRPYRTVLESVDPPRGSCDCPDFLRSSLGLCKHLLAVLDDVASKPRRFQQALREPAAGRLRLPQLRWDPVRPLTGPADPLDQIRWIDAPPSATGGNGAAVRLRRRFRRGRDGRLELADSYAGDPRRRLELVTELLAAARHDARGDRSGDPALIALLKLERERLEPLVASRLDPRTVRGALRTLKLKLYPYQRQGVDRFLEVGRLLLADDMGLGKTAQAIACSTILWRAGRVRRGLLLVPASLKPQWLREWQLFSDTPVEVVDGVKPDRDRLFRQTREGFLIANYEQLLRDLETVHRWRPDMVVLDEAQRIKNWATKTAAFVKTLKPPYRLVLTGTPMENRIDELASILDWVDDLALEPKWRLGPWHTTVVDGRREVAGARNLDTLRARLSGCMLRRVRQEVLEQLPPRTDVRVPVEMTPEQLEVHEKLKKPIRALLELSKKRPLTQAEFLRLMSLLTTQRIVSNGVAQLRFEEVWPEISRIAKPTDALLKSLSSPKLLELRELMGNLVLEQKRKVVVFSQWRRMLSLAHWATNDVLGQEGLRAVFFTGHESQKRRTQNLVDFHDDPETRILFASDAGGVGLNLQRAANCCLNLELPWNPAVLEQRIGRIYRIGQKRPIDVYNLVCEVGIESRIAQLVGDKRAFFTGLFDGTSDTIDFKSSGSFLSRLEKLVEPVKVPEIPAAAAPGGEGLDDDGEEREVEEILAQADEPAGVESAAEGEAGGEEAGEAGRRAPASGAEHRTDREEQPAAPDVAALFGKVEIRKKKDGRLVIEAEPEAASTLGALFEGMARLMREAAS